MRKYMIGYGIWNKQDMVGWLLEGIGANAQEVAHVRFVFDSCVDDSERNFDGMHHQILLNPTPGERENRTAHVTVTKESSVDVIHEVGIHNALIRFFRDETDCDVLIVPQDDQRIVGPIILRVERLLNKCGGHVGLIGGRDGYLRGLGSMVGSEWSTSTLTERLRPGAWVERPYLNSGPLIYRRDVVAKVGNIDTAYEHWYAWDDYCVRCLQAGFTNMLLGTKVRHLRFGRTLTTTYYTDGSQQRDYARFKSKCGGLAW